MNGPRVHIRPLTALALAAVCFAAALVAVWAAPRLSTAVALWMKAPAVHARTLDLSRLAVTAAPSSADTVVMAQKAGSAGAATTKTADARSSSPLRASQATTPGAAVRAAAVTLDPGLTFTMVGITCKPQAHEASLLVWLRSSTDGHSWSTWYSAELERGGDGNGVSPRAYTEPVWTGDGRYLQLAAAGPGAAPASLRDVKVVAINSEGDAGVADDLVGVVRHVAATVAGIDLAPPAEGMTTRPTIVTRAQWGANESLRGGSPGYAPVRMAFVHHTDGSNSYTPAEAPGIVRGIYYYHTQSLGWSDIGYDFLIDRYGTIYEGRYGGMTKGVIGAQVLGFNTGSTGVSIMGTFVHATPPAAALDSLEQLLAWKLDVSHIDPLGTAVLTCGTTQKFQAGQRVTFPAIAGHRQANFTDCPGDRLYALLPAIRQAVAAIGQPKIYDPTASDLVISPNGDGLQDSTTLGFTTSQPASWGFAVQDAAGDTVASFTGTGTSAAATWRGKDDAGNALPDGTYKVVATASTADGQARAAVLYVVLDTTPPSLRSAAVSPEPFSPNGDGADDRATLRYAPSEACSARVRVLDSTGAVVRTLSAWRTTSTAGRAVTWDGRVSLNGTLSPAAEGRYDLQLSLRDAAGNVASSLEPVTVDRTLGFPTATPAAISPNGDGVKDTTACGFQLTRGATVTVQVVRAGSVLATLDPVRLPAGAQTVTWDGKLNGAAAANGGYRLVVNAKGSLGTTTVSHAVAVDCYAPRLAAPATASVKLGKSVKLSYSMRDPYSHTVQVWATVADGTGTTVASLPLGWVRQGQSHICRWKPALKGAYTLSLHARDHAGNAQKAVTATALTVH
jgi:flagellar hook assembly protein FlgD